MEERLKELITESGVTITPFNSFTEVTGVIPLEKFMQMMSGLMREKLDTRVVRSATVLQPGQDRLARPNYRNPHVDFKITIQKQA